MHYPKENFKFFRQNSSVENNSIFCLLKDQDNYNINDIKSDDDTDDEDNPRKIIPKWACGTFFFQNHIVLYY